MAIAEATITTARARATAARALAAAGDYSVSEDETASVTALVSAIKAEHGLPLDILLAVIVASEGGTGTLRNGFYTP